jgi:hypothetical protein
MAFRAIYIFQVSIMFALKIESNLSSHIREYFISPEILTTVDHKIHLEKRSLQFMLISMGSRLARSYERALLGFSFFARNYELSFIFHNRCFILNATKKLYLRSERQASRPKIFRALKLDKSCFKSPMSLDIAQWVERRCPFNP